MIINIFNLNFFRNTSPSVEQKAASEAIEAIVFDADNFNCYNYNIRRTLEKIQKRVEKIKENSGQVLRKTKNMSTWNFVDDLLFNKESSSTTLGELNQDAEHVSSGSEHLLYLISRANEETKLVEKSRNSDEKAAFIVKATDALNEIYMKLTILEMEDEKLTKVLSETKEAEKTGIKQSRLYDEAINRNKEK